VGAHIVGGGASHDGFDLPAVGIVEEGGAGRAGDGDEAVFGVKENLEPVMNFSG
jgi:hypothetical protein